MNGYKQRLHLKGLVESGAMTRPMADKIMAAERAKDSGPKLEVISGDETTEIKLYDAIDSWGGWWGISADEVSQALDQVETSSIKLRINSPGGEVFEGIAIHNLFADHEADLHVVVDALAASIASVIAMAGDRISMNRGAEFMIHNAWGGVYGEASDMRKYADNLDRQCRKCAQIYASRAGGHADDWLAAMDAETWYLADEAIEAGLADDKIALKSKDGDGGAQNRWDLSIFNYAGRASAPDPLIPAKTDTSDGPVESTSEDAPDDSGDPAASAAGLDESRQRAAQVVARAKATIQIADAQIQ